MSNKLNANTAENTIERWANDEQLLDYLAVLSANGMPKKQIAKDKMGVTYQTLLNWERKEPKIKQALLTGWDDICDEIEGRMAKRARGYEYTETKTVVVGETQKGSGVVENQQIVRVEKQTKHMPADLGAQIFILRNKRGDRWKNKDADIMNEATGQIAGLIAGLQADRTDNK